MLNVFVDHHRKRLIAMLLVFLFPAVNVLGNPADSVMDSTDVDTTTKLATSTQSDMAGVYKTLLEDQRHTTDKILSYQQTIFVMILAGIAVSLAIAGFVTVDKVKNWIAESEKRYDQRVAVLISDTDNLMTAMGEFATAKAFLSEFLLRKRQDKPVRGDYSRVTWAFQSLVTAFNSLLMIQGNSPSLRNQYMNIFFMIRLCLDRLRSRNMFQQHVQQLKQCINRMRDMPFWKGDTIIQTELDEMTNKLDDEDRSSPLDESPKTDQNGEVS